MSTGGSILVSALVLSPDLRERVSEGHIVHLILDAVSRVPSDRFHLNWRGTGAEEGPSGLGQYQVSLF